MRVIKIYEIYNYADKIYSKIYIKYLCLIQQNIITFQIKYVILLGSVNLRHSTAVKFRSMRLDTALSLKLEQS